MTAPLLPDQPVSTDDPEWERAKAAMRQGDPRLMVAYRLARTPIAPPDVTAAQPTPDPLERSLRGALPLSQRDEVARRAAELEPSYEQSERFLSGRTSIGTNLPAAVVGGFVRAGRDIAEPVFKAGQAIAFPGSTEQLARIRASKLAQSKVAGEPEAGVGETVSGVAEAALPFAAGAATVPEAAAAEIPELSALLAKSPWFARLLARGGTSFLKAGAGGATTAALAGAGPRGSIGAGAETAPLGPAMELPFAALGEGLAAVGRRTIVSPKETALAEAHAVTAGAPDFARRTAAATLKTPAGEPTPVAAAAPSVVGELGGLYLGGWASDEAERPILGRELAHGPEATTEAAAAFPDLELDSASAECTLMTGGLCM